MAVSDAHWRAEGGPSIDSMLALAVEGFRVLAMDEEHSHRMADTQTTCAWHVTDRDIGLTALLDRDPIEAVPEVRDDVVSRIYGSERAWWPVLETGSLGIALVRGELAYAGPVREFMRVYPIFRTAYLGLKATAATREQV